MSLWSRRLAVLTCLAAASFALTACGDSGASKEELQEARQQGVAKARQQAKITQIQRELKALRKGKTGASNSTSPTPAPAAAPESVSSGNCGGSLSVNENTTCPFAANVESAYYSEIGSGSGTISAYSPAKDRYYSMHCSASSPHECTGGNNAAVYFP